MWHGVCHALLYGIIYILHMYTHVCICINYITGHGVAFRYSVYCTVAESISHLHNQEGLLS